MSEWIYFNIEKCQIPLYTKLEICIETFFVNPHYSQFEAYIIHNNELAYS